VRQLHDARRQIQLVRQRLLRRGQRSPDAQQPDVGSLNRDSREQLEKQIDALSRNRAAHVHDLDAAWRSEERFHLGIGLGVGFRRACRVHTQRNHRQSRGIDEPMIRERSPGRLADAQHASRATKSLEHAAAEALREQRPVRSLSKERAKRVGIVAEDDRALGRQHVHEVRIAVVGHVIRVEAVEISAEPARIVPEPVDDAIDGSGAAIGRKRQSPREGRAQARHGHRPIGNLGRVLFDHVRDEVHARPAFFAEVGNESDMERLSVHAAFPVRTPETLSMTSRRLSIARSRDQSRTTIVRASSA
jgi:hypothetical protein